MADERKAPDSATWKFNAVGGEATVTGTALVRKASFTLPRPLNSGELVWVSLYTAGLRTGQASYSQKDGAPELILTDSKLDSFALQLLLRLPTDSPRTRSVIHATFAQLLVAGTDSLVKSSQFPKDAPLGTDTAAVYRLAMVLVAEQGLPLSVISKSWALGLDSLSVQIRLRELIALGKVKAADTLRVFLPYPVKVGRTIAIDSSLEVGGTAFANVRGSFVGEKGKGILRLDYGVRRNGLDVSSLFEFNSRLAYLDTTRTLVLDDAFGLRATANATEGSYVLHLEARDDSGRKVVSETPLQVIPARDRMGPILSWKTPSEGLVLEYQDSVLHVVVEARDSSGVDTLWVQGVASPHLDSIWSGPLVIPVQELGYEIVARARDLLGNITVSTVRVVRKPKPGAPQVWKRMLIPTNLQLPFDTSLVEVVWGLSRTPTDVDSVYISGHLATRRTDTTWAASVQVPATGAPTTITLRAVLHDGAVIADLASLTRAPDTMGPTIQILSPTSGSIFEYGVSSIRVVVRATDLSGVDSVRMGGLVATRSGDSFSVVLPLAPTGTASSIRISAYDKLRNGSDTSITLTRKAPPDDLAPRIRLLWPLQRAGTVLPFDSLGLTTRWVVTDAFGIADTGVRIGGQLALRENDSTWSARLAVAPNGMAQTLAITVVNVKGVTNFDAISVARSIDKIAPVLVRAAATRDTSVAFGTASYQVEWTVTDNHKLQAVKIRGMAVAGSGTTYGQSIELMVGMNRVGIEAVDSTGNRTVDSINVIRLPDAQAPVAQRGPGAQDSVYAYGLDSATVTWMVRDNDQVGSVRIAGREVRGMDGIYTAKVALGPGTNGVVLVATDRTGNVARDSVTLTTKLFDTEGNPYRIGLMPDGKVWMAQNVMTRPRYGSSGCISKNCQVNGAFYSWSQAYGLKPECDTMFCGIDSNTVYRGICAKGWHVPSGGEWSALIHAASQGTTDSIGRFHLKAKAGWTYTGCESASQDIATINGDDLFGFNLLPNYGAGGPCINGGSYSVTTAEYWLPTEEEPDGVDYFVIFPQSIYFGTSVKEAVRAVRCLKD